MPGQLRLAADEAPYNCVFCCYDKTSAEERTSGRREIVNDVATRVIHATCLVHQSPNRSSRPAAGQSAWSFVNFKNNPCHEYSGGESQGQNVLVGQHPLQVGPFTWDARPVAWPEADSSFGPVKTNAGRFTCCRYGSLGAH